MTRDRVAILERLAIGIRPRGLVVDDHPNPLLTAIEEYIKQLGYGWMKLEFDIYRPTARDFQTGTIEEAIKEQLRYADFMLLDNRLERYKAVPHGLMLGDKIAQKYPRLRIFFYTAFSDDFKKPGRKYSLRPEVDRFLKRPNVTYYDKSRLTLENQLPALCGEMLECSFHKFATRANGNGFTSLIRNSAVRKVSQFQYRLPQFEARRTTQFLLSLDDPQGEGIEVPTEQLRNAGIQSSGLDIELNIIEFNGGQVLSFFIPRNLRKVDLPNDVTELLEHND